MSAEQRAGGTVGADKRARGRDKRAPGRDGGHVALEAALLIPVVLAFALMAIAAGRLQTSGAVVDAAARDGARAASLARTPEGAREAAAAAVGEVLADRNVRCNTEPVGPPVYGTLASAGGPLETVTVRVRCTVPLSDLLQFDGVPGQKTLTGEFTSVIDRYRGN